MNNISQSIKEILENEFGLYDLDTNTPIFSKKLLDSMDVLRLIMHLEDFFKIKINAFDISIDLLDTINSMEKIIKNQIQT